jgi:hypothetical protein
MVIATRALRSARVQAQYVSERRPSNIANVSVTERRQQKTRAETFRALQEYAESLSAAFSRTLIEKLPLEIHEVVLSNLTIDLENRIRLVH